MILVTAATTGGSVLFSSQRTFQRREHGILAYFGPFWLFCREIYALFGVLFAGLNNVVAYQNTENDKYQACPFVNVLIPLQVVFPEKENNV